MVTSQDFFQPLRDYLREPPKVSGEIRFLQVRVAGNRAESNPFVLYAYAS